MPKLQRSSQWTWCCLAVLSTALSASAQISPNESQSAPRLIPRTKAERDAQYSFHHRILLNVQVTDSSGHPVIGLNAGDFNLQINKSPQAITTFKAVADSGNTAKAHAFLIVDLLNNSARDLAHGYRAIKALAGSNRLLPMPTSIAVLTDKGFEVSSASRNADELAAHWKEATKGFHLNDCTEDWNNAGMGKAIATMGSLDDVNRAKNREDAAARIGNCLNEKYQLSFTALVGFAHRQQNVPGRAILIWIGPG